MRLQIIESSSGKKIVDAYDEQAIVAEGNWYIAPDAVAHAHLELTAHEYVCPYKGRCFYVDFVDGESRVPRIAWVYDDPKPDWVHIKGHYGFYKGETAASFGKTREEIEA